MAVRRRSLGLSRGLSAVAVAGGALALTAALVPGASATEDVSPVAAVGTCSPGSDVVISEAVGPEDAKTYRVFPVEVAGGTTRIELSYTWEDNPGPPANPVTDTLAPTVLDLGLWQGDNPSGPEAFRGWSGSRGGITHRGHDPVFVQADTASRGYLPGPIQAGLWWPEIGIAAVAEQGSNFTLTMSCLPDPGPETGWPEGDMPSNHTVEGTGPGWYHGDFHMHGYHSASDAPDWTNGESPGDPDSFVEFARAAGLDFTPVTEYVTTQHWRELGPVQDANPDLVIWPSREVITYFGHATVFGETPGTAEYRHGFTPPGASDPISLGDIQQAAKEANEANETGALFGIAHPTSFPGPVFASFCRGCEFTLDDDVDFSLVDTIEVLTGPILVNDSEIPGNDQRRTPGEIQNPFVESAIDYWEDKLLEGYRITAVSGSDDKQGPGLGSSATAVWAQQLSRAGLVEGVRSGRAYVKTRGVDGSPNVEVTATDPVTDRTYTIGDSIPAGAVHTEVHVTAAAGQLLRISADGVPMALVPIGTDDETIRFDARQLPTSGPLGTFWRVDTLDARSLTTIGNPFFLTGS